MTESLLTLRQNRFPQCKRSACIARPRETETALPIAAAPLGTGEQKVGAGSGLRDDWHDHSRR